MYAAPSAHGEQEAAISCSREHSLCLSFQPSSPPINVAKLWFPGAQYLPILPSLSPLASAQSFTRLALAGFHHREAGKERSRQGLFPLLAQWGSLKKFRMVFATLTCCVSQLSLLIFPFAYAQPPSSLYQSKHGPIKFSAVCWKISQWRAWKDSRLCFPIDKTPSGAEPSFAASHLPLENTETFGELSHWILLPCSNARRLESDLIHTKRKKPNRLAITKWICADSNAEMAKQRGLCLLSKMIFSWRS